MAKNLHKWCKSIFLSSFIKRDQGGYIKSNIFSVLNHLTERSHSLHQMHFLKFPCFYYECEAYLRGTILTTSKHSLSYPCLSSQINRVMRRASWDTSHGDRNGQVMAFYNFYKHGRNDPILLLQSSVHICRGWEH